MSKFESRLSAALDMIQQKTVYLAAVSGGADSTAMLAGLAALRKEKGFTLHCIHVEHGIRSIEESRGDAQAVEALCEKLDVPCRVYSIPQGKVAAFASNGGPGIEGAARYFRHRALRKEARRIKADRILTAHTRDDLIENLLMRILKGSGPRGLAAMPKSRGLLLRPLLDMTRQEVLEYLEEQRISYRIDSTNSEIHYLRNRVRHKLMPILDEFFPSWRTSLLALAETQSLTADFLEAEAKKRLQWEKKLSFLRLNEADFLNAPQILREEAIFFGANILTARRSGPVPRRAVVRNAAKKPAGQDLGPVRFDRQNGFITLKPVLKAKASSKYCNERGFSLLINEAGLYTLKGKVLGLGKNRDLSIRVDSSARFPMVFRNHMEGDRIIRGRHRRRFSDILGKAVHLVCVNVITACNADGPAAFIGISQDGDIIVAGREASETGVFKVSFIEAMDI